MFFKKKSEKVNKEKDILASVDGKLIPIEDVKDPVFSKRMMGDGFAIESVGNEISACCDAKVTMVFPSNHAIGLTCDDGMEILIHIGIDTVNEDGKGFTLLTQANTKVSAGDPLVQIDRPYLQEKGYDLTVMMIFTNAQAYDDFAIAYGKDVKMGTLAGKYYIK